MALFSSNTSMVQRSKGENAIATAAYYSRSKLKLYQPHPGVKTNKDNSWDYRENKQLLYSKIHADPSASDWVFDRKKLWNRAEEVEKRDDAQVARKIRIALPVELNIKENIKLLEEFIFHFVEMGMVVDANIHSEDSKNPYGIMILTTRKLLLDKSKVSTFDKVKNREWGARSFVNWHRELWADLINKHLRENGFEEKVSHLSYKAQGINKEPTRHRGTKKSKWKKDQK